MARLRMEQGRLLEAEGLLRKAHAIRVAKMGPGDPRAAQAELYLGICLAELGHRSEARTLLTHGLSIPLSRRREDRHLTRHARAALAGL
jgi:Flp pilus assembly protein TadD